MEAPEIKPRRDQQGWLLGPYTKRDLFWDRLTFIVITGLLVLVGLGTLYFFYLLASI